MKKVPKWLSQFFPLLFSFLAGAALLRLWEFYEIGRLLSGDAVYLAYMTIFSGGLAVYLQLHVTGSRSK